MTLKFWPDQEFLHTILLEITKGESFRLPVNPESLPQDSPFAWSDRDIIGIGESSFPLYPKQETIIIESFFPRDWDPTYCAIPQVEMKTPLEYVALLKNAAAQHKTLRVMITSSHINDEFTIRSFKTRLEGGEPGDIYYTLELKTYREGLTRRVSGSLVPTEFGTSELPPGFPAHDTSSSKSNTITPAPVGENSNRPNPQAGVDQPYMPTDGESLRDIATKFLTGPDDWKHIYLDNRDAMRFYPVDVVQPDQLQFTTIEIDGAPMDIVDVGNYPIKSCAVQGPPCTGFLTLRASKNITGNSG